MILAIDIDGPVANFRKAYLSYCNMRFGYEMKEEQQTVWMASECPQFPITPEEDKLAFEEFCNIRMFAALELTPGAKEGLCALSGEGHDIVYITDRPKSAHRTTAKYLVKMGLPMDGLLFSNGNKGELAKAIGASVSLDDRPINCIKFSEAITYSFLWDASYNQTLNTSKIHRVKSWFEFTNKVGQIVKKRDS